MIAGAKWGLLACMLIFGALMLGADGTHRLIFLVCEIVLLVGAVVMRGLEELESKPEDRK